MPKERETGKAAHKTALITRARTRSDKRAKCHRRNRCTKKVTPSSPLNFPSAKLERGEHQAKERERLKVQQANLVNGDNGMAENSELSTVPFSAATELALHVTAPAATHQHQKRQHSQRVTQLPTTYTGHGQRVHYKPTRTNLLKKCLSGIFSRRVRLPEFVQTYCPNHTQGAKQPSTWEIGAHTPAETLDWA